ncbi:MAG: hypothetical protein WD871_03165 [Xanthobacteraceae bacterium]
MEHANDPTAPAGVKEVRIAFDLSTGDGKTLLNFLDVIDEMRQSLIKEGVKPQLVLALRGPATRLVQTNLTQIKPEDHESAAKIAEKVNGLRTAEGVDSIEQCGVAMRRLGIKPQDVIPGIHVVGNSWISLSVYQAKGYAYIAP